MDPVQYLDRIKGMFIGHFLGDALGVPHEFKCNALTPYTGKLEHEGFIINRFHGKMTIPVGSCSDDTAMTLCLLRQILKDNEYNRVNVCMAYMTWANSGTWVMGINTKALFKGVKTFKGYEKRREKILPTQSNGALMRCTPLVLLPDNTAVVTDAMLSNPDIVCIDCNLIYITCLRYILIGTERKELLQILLPLAQTSEVSEIIVSAANGEMRNISTQKGWCLHALWCALYAINSDMTYTEAMKFIITIPGSDTDTNACIAGALLGAYYGYDVLYQEQKDNIDIITGKTIDSDYMPHDFEELMSNIKGYYGY